MDQTRLPGCVGMTALGLHPSHAAPIGYPRRGSRNDPGVVHAMTGLSTACRIAAENVRHSLRIRCQELIAKSFGMVWKIA
jgi:hypothetical protein